MDIRAQQGKIVEHIAEDSVFTGIAAGIVAENGDGFHKSLRYFPGIFIQP